MKASITNANPNYFIIAQNSPACWQKETRQRRVLRHLFENLLYGGSASGGNSGSPSPGSGALIEKEKTTAWWVVESYWVEGAEVLGV